MFSPERSVTGEWKKLLTDEHTIFWLENRREEITRKAYSQMGRY